jgi:hypothetical protein
MERQIKEAMKDDSIELVLLYISSFRRRINGESAIWASDSTPSRPETFVPLKTVLDQYAGLARARLAMRVVVLIDVLWDAGQYRDHPLESQIVNTPENLTVIVADRAVYQPWVWTEPKFGSLTYKKFDKKGNLIETEDWGERNSIRQSQIGAFPIGLAAALKWCEQQGSGGDFPPHMLLDTWLQLGSQLASASAISARSTQLEPPSLATLRGPIRFYCPIER